MEVDSCNNTSTIPIVVWTDDTDMGVVHSAPPVPPTPKPIASDPDWLTDSFLKVKISRKRKSSELSDFRELETAEVHLNDSFSDSRRVRLTKDAERTLILLEQTFQNEAILERTFHYLSDADLEDVSRVSRSWRRLSVSVLRKRVGNAPFLLFWKNSTMDEEPDQDLFSEMLCSYFYGSWLTGDYKAVKPVDTIICFGSVFITLGQSDFFSSIGGDFKFLYAAGYHLAAGFPGKKSRVAELSYGKELAFQSICIPQDPTIEFVSIAIPVWSSDTYSNVYNSVANTHFGVRNDLTKCGKPLLGLLITTYLEDSLTEAFAKSYAESSETVGMIGACMEGVSCSDLPGQTSVAAVLALHGMNNVEVATFGFTMTELNLTKFTYLANKFFEGATNKFVIMVYRLLFDEKYLKALVTAIGDIPIIGMETYHAIQFRGFLLDEKSPPTFLKIWNWSEKDERIQVALFLAKY